VISGVCIITAEGLVHGRTHLDVAKAAVEAGVDIVQLRDKTATTRKLFETARQIRELTRGTRTRFVVNDRLDVALAAAADGVHIGDEDLPPDIARRIMGPNAIIGVSAATLEEAVKAERAGATYLGVGPMFPTTTKPDAGEAVGPKRISEIKSAVSIPVLGIGGITCENAHLVFEAGADGVAVISAVAAAEDMVQTARKLCETAARYGKHD
jgi:thiamine-phosphate diphosphorylase